MSTQRVVQFVCTPLAIITNCTLILVVLKKSPESMGLYKFLMIYISVYELIFTTLDILLAPDAYSYDTIFIMITRADKLMLPSCMKEVASMMFCVLFGESLAVFSIHFVYRYLAVTGHSFLKTESLRKTLIWFLIPVFYGFLWAVNLYCTLWVNANTEQILQGYGYLGENNLNITDITYIGPNYWKLDENGNEVINWKTILGMAIASTLISISFAMIAIFATLSYREVSKLTELTSHSGKFRSMQLQLLNSLVLQSLVPAFFIQLPSFVLFLAPFFHCGRSVFGEIIGVTVALYPVLDSLPTMLVIKAYREAIFHCCPFTNKNSTHSTSVAPATIP